MNFGETLRTHPILSEEEVQAVRSEVEKLVQHPAVGRIVHFVGEDPEREYAPVCRAAIITEVGAPLGDEECVALAVLNRTGMSFELGCAHDEDSKVRDTWHWPERV